MLLKISFLVPFVVAVAVAEAVVVVDDDDVAGGVVHLTVSSYYPKKYEDTAEKNMHSNFAEGVTET